MTTWLTITVVILLLAYIPYWFFLINYNTIDNDSEKNKFWTTGNTIALGIFIALVAIGIIAAIVTIFKDITRVGLIHRGLYNRIKATESRTDAIRKDESLGEEEQVTNENKAMSAYKPGKCNQIIVNMQG